MKTLWARLHWAVIGYKSRPWPPPCPELPEAEVSTPEAPEWPPSEIAPIPLSNLRGTLKLAADLLAPHFQSAISAQSVAYNGIFDDPLQNKPADLLTAYVGLAGTDEEVDIFLSSAAWLAKQEYGHGRSYDDDLDTPRRRAERAEEQLRRMFEVAVRDIFHF